MRKALAAALVALSLAVPAAAQQQQRPPMWPAQAMLANTSGTTISLKNKSGQVVQTFDREAIRRAIDVAQRLAPAYGISVPALYITPSASPNAFATFNKEGQPIVAVNTAMLKLAGDNEDYLATVMGHELGHVVARHPIVGAQRAGSVNALGAILGEMVDMNEARHGHNTGGAGRLLGGVGAGLVNAKFSRDQEREADQLGITAMAKAGFDPGQAVAFWQLMARAGGGGSGFWLDDHPSDEEREHTLQALASQLASVYAANRHAPEQLAQPSVGTGAAPGAFALAAHWKPYSLTARQDDPHDGYPVAAYVVPDPLPEEIAQGAPYAVARAAYKAQDWQRARELLAPLVAANEPRAMLMAADMAQRGLGRDKDSREARDLLERSARMGFARSMTVMGEALAQGTFGEKDQGEAMKWLMLADTRGDARAHSRLAFAYLLGAGVDMDPGLARTMAQQAADANDDLGRALLGALMRDGIGGPADAPAGVAILSGVADRLPWARFQLGVAYEQGKGVPADRDKAIELFTVASKAGVVAATQRLAALGVK